MSKLYDKRCGITRDETGRAAEIEAVDCWWNRGVSEDMPIYRYQDEEREPDGDNDDDFEIVGFDLD